MTRGIISFVFDDGYERVYQNVIPLLNRYNIPGVFAIPINGGRLEKAEQRKIRPWQQWVNIVNDGHEIASHSKNHPNLTHCTEQELEEELRDSAQLLQATTLIYPGGAVDQRVVTAAKKYYSAGRTVRYGFESLKPRDPMHLKSYNFSRNNFSVFKANRLALWAFLTNSWLIETYHMVDDDDLEMLHTVKTKEFKQHLDFISRIPIAAKTIRDVINPS